MRLLLVEDEPKLARAIAKALRQQGYAVDVVNDGDEGLAMATTESYDAMLIDRMLPGESSGTDIVKAVRQKNISTPIMLLTALGTVRDKTDGLDGGADDYLVKPFDLDELFARVRALLRRPAATSPTELRLDNLILDVVNRTAQRGKKEIKLTKTEFSLLEYLVRHSPQALSKATLIEHVWDFDADILPNTVEVYIRNLRRKIDRSFKSKLIHTVRDVGYKAEAVSK